MVLTDFVVEYSKRNKNLKVNEQLLWNPLPPLAVDDVLVKILLLNIKYIKLILCKRETGREVIVVIAMGHFISFCHLDTRFAH